MKNHTLALIHDNRHYTWPELTQLLATISQPVIAIPAEDRFTTTLQIIQAFRQNSVVFPVSHQLASSEQIKLLEQLRVVVNDADHYSLAIATSGTQAAPKIALISRANIVSHCDSFNRMIPMEQHSIWLNCMPMNHIAGVMIIFRCWFNQSTMLLHDSFDAQKIWNDLHHYKVTHLSLVPIMLEKLLDISQNSAPPESFKYLLVGGDQLSETLYQRAIDAGWPVYISYGMTEAASTVAIGRQINHLNVLDGLDVCLSQQGTLKIKGKMIISAYADLNNESFTDGWFETSDRANINDNTISILGRSDHMIIAGGENIAPQYLEQRFSQAPGIIDIAIGKYRDSGHQSDWGDTIGALICGDVQKFQRWQAQCVEPRYQAKYLIKCKKIPRNALGKIDRKAVQKHLNREGKN